MAVVSRMQVVEVTNRAYGPALVKLQCQYVPEGDPAVSAEELAEIRSFSDATPSGHLEMNINNEKAAEQFQAGEVFYLHLEKRQPADA